MSDSPVATPTPDYAELASFLFKPFLDHPEALRIDVEFSPVRQKVLIRVAFGEADRGRALGRGGRNVNAIRTAIEGIAKVAGHSAHVEVFGMAAQNNAFEGRRGSSEGRYGSSSGGRSSRPPDEAKPSLPKPMPKRKIID